MSDNRPLILCLDDDPDILSFLQIVLEKEGYAFVGAGSAEEGLRTYKEVRPDVVIVDLMMLSSVGDNLSMTTDYSALGLAGVFQKPLSKDLLLTVLKTKLAETARA